jgi:hypothetical protein
MASNCWIDLNGRCLYEPPKNEFGFIYKITILPSKEVPKELWGKIYIGKKQFTFSVKRKITKKVKKETGTRKRVERVKKDSNWLDYWGSSKELLADISKYGKDNFMREVICFCKSKQELSYYEVVHQIDNNVLLIDSYNKWISCKIYKHLLNK